MALATRLEQDGFDASDVVTAINAALAAGVLVQAESGSIHKSRFALTFKTTGHIINPWLNQMLVTRYSKQH